MVTRKTSQRTQEGGARRVAGRWHQKALRGLVGKQQRDGGALGHDGAVGQDQRRYLRQRIDRRQLVARRGGGEQVVEFLHRVVQAVPDELGLDERRAPALAGRKVCNMLTLP